MLMASTLGPLLTLISCPFEPLNASKCPCIHRALLDGFPKELLVACLIPLRHEPMVIPRSLNSLAYRS